MVLNGIQQDFSSFGSEVDTIDLGLHGAQRTQIM
jgi:hypothetical protein